jgi:hypothetical protein
MKADNRTIVVLVQHDSARLARKRVGAFEPFTTVRFEDRKRAVAAKYGVFWSLISRRIL